MKGDLGCITIRGIKHKIAQTLPVKTLDISNPNMNIGFFAYHECRRDMSGVAITLGSPNEFKTSPSLSQPIFNAIIPPTIPI